MTDNSNLRIGPKGRKGCFMKYAADFRQEARAALQGKWPLAILVGLVAAILGGATSGGPEFKINFTGGSLNANIQYAGQTIYSWGDGITPGLRAVLVGGAIYLILAAIVLGVLYFILGSVIEVGYARFNLNLTAGEKTTFETLFSYFPYWKTIAVTMLLQAVYILLWTLLLIIPGIMASYSYAMTGYILAEHPELTAGEQNNVLHAKRLLDLLTAFPPEEYFCVSTDKAANPVNIMGASKRIMEDVIFSYSDKFPVKTVKAPEAKSAPGAA